MTRVDFYFNVANKPALLHELVQVALSKRRLVTITVIDEAAAKVASAALWQTTHESFLPSVLVNNPLAVHTPIVLHWQNQPVVQDELLINLNATQPSFFSQFTQLIELVGDDEQDKTAARERYKFYRDRGYEIKNIDHIKVAAQLNTHE